MKFTKITSLALGGLLPLSAVAHQQSSSTTQVLPRHAALKVSTVGPINRLEATRTLDLVVGLPLREPEELDRLLRQLYDSKDPHFRKFLAPAEFTERFGPSPEQYQQVLDGLTALGLTVTETHPNRMLLNVSGKVEDIERAFHVNLLVYPHPTEPRVFFAPDRDPSVELTIPLLHISGLDNYDLPKSNLRLSAARAQLPSHPKTGSGPEGTLWGKDFRKAYAPDVTLDGAGQVVGLLEFDGYYPSDIAKYVRLTGLPSVALENVLLARFNGTPGDDNGEVALDIEMVIAMAPKLSKIVVYEAGHSGKPEDILNRMANDNAAKQLSSSWAWLLENPTTEQIYKQFAAQGQSFFNASGDDGAYSVGDARLYGLPYPVANPYVTVVGGTTLTTKASGGAWTAETAWNDGQGGGTGGGFGFEYPLPLYQFGIDMSLAKGSSAFRNLPDVAMVADNIVIAADHGQLAAVAGTSCAAPLWAGFTALVNQYALQNNQPPVGFLNPALYAIGKSSAYASCFHDIQTGDNDPGNGDTAYPAVMGYDLCTGWGTPNGMALIKALTASSAPAALRFSIQASGPSAAGRVQVAFPGHSGVGYVLEATTDLQHWHGVAALTASTDGTATLSDPDSSSHPARFYRVRVQE